MTDRTLVLVRHAKATHPERVADLERPLDPRGHADAEAAGAWLTAQRLLPDVVLCSPARRARQTWHSLAATLGEEATHTTVGYSPVVYRASSGEELLDALRAAEPEAATLMMVGHNPTLSMLSSLLDPSANEALRTCGIAVHRVPGAWRDLAPGKAPRIAAHTARA
ncbi:histidine phosphatase family protein [Planosporangium thailandense]|uniref:Histidine phosphatase family protein n=1 Tax=Planosporangium thailandense TaxID=765197 RepID=A0ABX0XTR5_9ACTN|nr:histidine phosphatase family protein [Planosporangium thailandense]NJC68742.1 histidine phosphatase family protein [Planosporangium thailandense]